MSTVIPIKINATHELIVEPCRCSTTILEPSTARPGPVPEPAPVAAEYGKGSYGQILKSSALIGGSQVANIAISIVRTKAMAMLLGPAGFGLFGLYGSIQNLSQSIAGMGINSSGVRQIAEATGSGDRNRIAKTAAILRRTAIAVGLLGAMLLLILSRPVSQLTFGSTRQAASVALLSFAVLFTLIAGGQMALIQGMRRIADLARINVLGALFGLFTSIPLVYFFGQEGVVPSMISVAAMTILTSWWFSRKIKVRVPRVTISEVWGEASALLKLGTAFMASSLMTMGVAYFVRVILLRKVGFEATGLYQSAWTLGGLYVGFILQAMGADFYPRLTASIHKHEDANRLVNEQTLIGLLLAGPGVVATLTFAPLVIAVLYSAKFAAAVTLLRWICLGVMLQVITWPMGYIIVAKGRPAIFFAAELAWTLVAITLSWWCVTRFGLNGAGIAFFGSYVFHCLLLYPVVRWLSGFRWSEENRQKGAVFLASIGIVFAGFHTMPFWLAETIGILFAIASGVYSIRVLLRLVASHRLSPAVRRILQLVGLLSPEYSNAGADLGLCGGTNAMSSVDVIVPCYRYGHFLRQCVESVLTQSGPSVRVLIIDDASPDNTSEVASELAREDSRITFQKHKTNKGHIATYNEGIDWASADYMLLLSADDYLLPGALHRAIDLMQKHPEVGFTFGNAIRLDEHGIRTAIETVKVTAGFRILNGMEFIQISDASNIVPAPTAVVRTRLHKHVGGYQPELPHSGDMEMWLRLAANGPVGIVNSYQAVYRRHSSNMSLAYMANSFLPEIQQRKAALDYFFTNCNHHLPDRKSLERRFYLSLGRSAVGLASSAFTNGQTTTAEELSRFALEMCPAVRFSRSWVKFVWISRIRARAASVRKRLVKKSQGSSVTDTPSH